MDALQARLVELLKLGLANKLPLLTAPRKWVDGTMRTNTATSVKVLVTHLMKRRAEKTWLLEWLSTLH